MGRQGQVLPAQQRSPRGYQLEEQERVFVVNSLIRLPKPIEFEPLLGALARGSRSRSNALRVLLDKSLLCD